MKAERLAEIREHWLQMEMNDRDLASFAQRVLDPLFSHIDKLEKLVPDAGLMKRLSADAHEQWTTLRHAGSHSIAPLCRADSVAASSLSVAIQDAALKEATDAKDLAGLEEERNTQNQEDLDAWQVQQIRNAHGG